jgi:lipid-binding SYLF domain-containing protein
MKEMIKRVCMSGTWVMIGILTTGLLFVSLPSANAASKAEAQSIVDKSRGTLSDFMSDANYSWLQRNLRNAKGVLIFPQIIKGGFFIGGSGGTGILFVRDAATGSWSDPAFYTMGSVTFGLQIGGEAAEVMMLAMSQKAIDTLFASSVKLGGDASIALGPVGGGAKGGVTVPDVTADFLSFAKSKGLYAGLNLEGSVLAVRDSLNDSYYGRSVKPVDIIVKKNVSNPGAKELRAALYKASERRK